MFKTSDFIRQSVTTQGGFKPDGGWVILSPLEATIKNKIEAVGTPLKDWNINIYRGILTGYNDAFIIDQKTRDALMEASPKNDEIIRPILRGRDIKKYSYDFADLWLINTHNGIKEKGIKPVDINLYPAVKKYLDHFYPELENRVDKGVTPYNLRNCAYLEDFSKQKIVWGEISDKANFALDIHDNYYVNNKCYLLTGNRLEYLICFLNSKVSEYLFSKIGTTTGVGTAQWSKFTIEQLCVPLINEDQEKEFIFLVSDLSAKKLTEAAINQRIYTICGLTSEEVAFIESL
ncbi:MAG: hypothetical protein JWP44_3231 [Mucilaginibacter sp.]|nr:hypothetical protein [Mucilaginibacter sp.]